MGLNGRLELMRVPFFSTTLKLRTMRRFKEFKKLAFDRCLGCLGHDNVPPFVYKT